MFRKSSDFSGAMSSSLVLVYLDENTASINDGFFFGNPTLGGIGDRPAVNHGHASSMSFADGHAEIHPWNNTFLNTNSVGGIAAKQSDGVWLAQHLSAIQ
jgi:prepilin-type processing-associated H-X9-DG protein